MYTENNIKGIITGGFEVFLGGESLGILKDEDVSIEIDSNIFTAKSMKQPGTPLKHFTGGESITASFTLLEKSYSHLVRIMNNFKGVGISTTDPFAGVVSGGSVAQSLKPQRLVMKLHHVTDDGVKWYNQAANPLTFEIFKAVCSEPLTWNFPAGEAAGVEVTFEGQLDITKPDDENVFKFGAGIETGAAPVVVLA